MSETFILLSVSLKKNFKNDDIVIQHNSHDSIVQIIFPNILFLLLIPLSLYNSINDSGEQFDFTQEQFYNCPLEIGACFRVKHEITINPYRGHPIFKWKPLLESRIQ